MDNYNQGFFFLLLTQMFKAITVCTTNQQLCSKHTLMTECQSITNYSTGPNPAYLQHKPSVIAHASK